MDESRLEDLKRAFRPIPDSDAYYAATSHEQALACALGALADDEGMALIVGGPGLGKTLLGHCFLDRLGGDVASAFLLTTHFREPAALLQELLYDFALPYEGRTEEEMRLALTDHLLQNYEGGRKAVLVIDEAQHLSPAVLEELRLLGNLEGRKGKAAQSVLLSLPSILDTLQAPELESFQQRLAARAELRPFDQHEATDFLLHQARRVCPRPEEFLTEEALQIVAQSCQGIPRLLNRAMHKALSLAQTGGADVLDAEAVLEAVAALGLVQEEAAPFAGCEEGERTEVHPARDGSRGHRLFAGPRRIV
jgi:type II secretory pathway predicted ATPase ExeA